jgi:DNA repair exonuclease SbcCD ATPase subunit
MEILKVQIKNFLSIADVEITPGQVNQIVGRNNAGKTTVIKALEFAIKGSSDGSLVKFGEESAEVVLELSDQTTVRRRINADGKQTVDVKREGMRSTSPQSYLDALFDGDAFNPLDLLDAKRRSDAILKSIDLKVTAQALANELGVSLETLPPLDYSQHGLKVLEQAHRYFYQRRAEANKDAADKRKRWETYLADLPKPSGTPPLSRELVNEAIQANERVIRELHGQVESIERSNEATRQEHDRAQQRVIKWENALVGINNDIVRITGEITKLQSELKIAETRLFEGQKVVEGAREEIPSMELESTDKQKEAIMKLRFDNEKLNSDLMSINAFDAVEKSRAMVRSMEAEYQSSQAFADSLTKKVEALAGPVKAKLMATAEMPVPGLEYKDGGFLVDGATVDNLSASKAMKLSVAVARRLAKKTKLICLDGAEALDEHTYRALRDEINDDGYTYFITKVGIPFAEAKDKVIAMDNGRTE